MSMSNETYGLSTDKTCPCCQRVGASVALLTVAENKRQCPRCGFTEPNPPTTKSIKKDYLHA